MTEPVVEAHELGLAYRLPHQQVGTLKEYMIHLVKRQVRYETLWALQDVSLEVAPGEMLGVIGPNGAGKSTLMKIIARVLPPTSGRVVVRGLVAPMIELGAGFNEELTAAENVVLYGALLGRHAGEMRRRLGPIAEWAELEEFLDVPVRSYSSGMLSRLGFAVATDVRPDLLVVDEVLSVGDAQFQRRSRQRIVDLVASGTAVVLVSHALDTIRECADRVLWLDHGHVKMLGDATAVVEAYSASA